MSKQRGLTLLEGILLTMLVAGACAFLVFAVFRETARRREMGRRIHCIGNLCQLAKGAETYLNVHGGDRWYAYPLGLGRNPAGFNGSEWLASLYWADTVPDPGVFLCPSTPDTNGNGKHLGATRAGALFGSQTVSYAGMHYYSLTGTGGKPVPAAIPEDYDPNLPMASDDTQGTINHGAADNGGMNVLFFDSHVDWKTNEELDIEHAVGRKGGLLWQLRN